MKIALYCRVSTLLQFEKGNSIDEQKKRLKAYCVSRGWEDYTFFVDGGHSGSSLDRPALQDLLRKIKKYDVVLVYKLDRLSRNQRDILYLIEDVFIKNGVAFNSITENFDTSTPTGRLMLSMMGAFAELERQQINERMMMGRIASVSKGKWRGGSGVPTGYKFLSVKHGGDGYLHIDEAEAMKVRDMFTMFENGHNYNSINTKYHFASANVVRKILENPVYIGKLRYAGEIYDGGHEPIISVEQFEKVQSIIRHRDADLNFPSLKERHLLTGFLKCSCGARACYHNVSKKNKDGSRTHYQYYECYTRMAHGRMRKAKTCKNKIWRCADLEAVIWDEIEGLEFDEVKREAPDLKPLENKIKKIDKQISKLLELYALDGVPMDTLTAQINALNSKRNELDKEIIAQQEKASKLTKSDVRKLIRKVDSIKEADLQTQREFLSVLIEEITLLPAHDLRIKWRF